ncbi:MAG: ImmA/IrrE family metallo-endopeptidase [Bacteroidetes bacterium]|nr:ImmA/IrrE family metallo-endopeptidase [Bacteroidota bacterium]
MATFNTEVLALARESRGYTQAYLSDELKVEQGTISKIENGRLNVSEDLAKSIATFLDYPLELFYLDKKVIRVEGHYRKKSSLSVKEVKEYRAKMTFAEWHVNKLVDSVDIPNVNIPSWDIDIDGGVLEAAKHAREFWGIPRGRINDLAKVLEDNGIVIVPLDLGDMDGLSTYSAEYNIPIVYINKNRPADRIRMSLAHEAAHYILHFGKKVSEDRDIEKEAREFASELLLPSSEISPYFNKLTLEKLADLKRYWKASMAAILYKASAIGAITPNQSKYLWQQMAAKGYKKNEPIDIEADKPSLLREIIDTYIEDLGYNKAELANILHITENEFDVNYLGARPKPKIKIAIRRSA